MYAFQVAQGWAINNEFHDLMATANLVFQFVILGTLLIGVWVRRSRGNDLHGNVVLAALLMGVVSTLLAMVPSLFDIWVTQRWLFPFTILHSAVGTVALVTGGWLVGAWALKDGDPRYCAGRGRKMRLVLYVWVASAALGVALYAMHILYSA